MRVAVAGGTGVVGRKVVAALEHRGHDAVVLARSHGTDLTSDEGLGGALHGIESVIDVTSVASTRRADCVEFFTTVSSNLLDAGARAGVAHHVTLSIIGIDGLGFGYYQGKVAQEQTVTTGPVPWSILRAAQFHEFPAQVMQRASFGPVALVPLMRTQPVAAAEVAEALVDLATSDPSGRVPDLAGPREEQLVDMARSIARRRGERRLVIPVPVPGSTGTAMRNGTLLPQEPGPRGTQTFAEWLESGAAETG